MTGQTAVTTARRGRVSARLAGLSSASWTASYLRQACLADGLCGLLAGVLAYVIRFSSAADRPAAYLAISLLLPVCWLLTILMAGGYDSRFIGVGTDEFRKILNAGVFPDRRRCRGVVRDQGGHRQGLRCRRAALRDCL